MKRNILLVDDEDSIRAGVSKLLQSEGYHVTIAHDGCQAADILARERVDLLLLDLGLPGQDGWSILGWLTEANPLLPVIVITGRWNQRQRASAARADVLMEKPLDVPLMLDIIQELLAETPEARSQRMRSRNAHLRHVPCDAREFCEQLHERYTTPLSYSESALSAAR